jgi:hypothetical protein
MISLFRLLWFTVAELFKRSYTSSGTPLSVRLVGMSAASVAGWNRYGTTAVPMR